MTYSYHDPAGDKSGKNPNPTPNPPPTPTPDPNPNPNPNPSPNPNPNQVPLLLIEIIFCCNLSPDETSKKAWALGVSSGLMIILGYPGELIIEGDLGVRFMFWFAAMIPFLYVVYTLLVGLKEAIASEGNPKVATMLTQVRYATAVRVRARARARARARVTARVRAQGQG